MPGVLLVRIIVGQWPTVLAIGAGRLELFSHLSSLPLCSLGIGSI